MHRRPTTVLQTTSMSGGTEDQLTAKPVSAACSPCIVYSFLCIVCLEDTAIGGEGGNREIVLHAKQ